MVGIVVVNYRSDEMTVRFVREELSRIDIPYRVVVVNNGGTDSGNLQERMPGVTVLTAENRGYAYGCNRGAEWLQEQVHPDAILFCNNDIRFGSDDVVDAIYAQLFWQDDVGAIGPSIVGTDGRRQSPEPYYPFQDGRVPVPSFGEAVRLLCFLRRGDWFLHGGSQLLMGSSLCLWASLAACYETWRNQWL